MNLFELVAIITFCVLLEIIERYFGQAGLFIFFVILLAAFCGGCVDKEDLKAKLNSIRQRFRDMVREPREP